MKITLFIGCLLMSAGVLAQSQTITLSETNASLKDLFKAISRQTGYDFVYDSKTLATATPVTIEVKNATLEQVLQICFKGQPMTYTISGNTIVVKPLEKSEAKLSEPKSSGLHYVEGRVVDKTGGAIPGVNILIRGTSEGTVTDAQGKYSIQVNDSDILAYSFIGFKRTETEAGDRTVIDVTLEEEVSALKAVEVVGTSYWSSTKVNSTSSIVKIEAKDIETQPITSPLLGLQGRVAGLDITPGSGAPGSAPRIKIRGNNSLRSDGGYPLYVIDGIPIASDPITSENFLVGGGFDPLSTINPANIESVEVLKDGDATAIYGSRGANGVIVIKTKKNISSTGTGINMSIYSGIGQVSRKMNVLNREQYLTMRRQAFQNDGLAPDINTGYDLLVWDTTRNTDWQKVLMGGTSNIADVQITLSGGNKNTSFQFGGGYHRETLIFPGDFDYRRINGKLNLTHYSSDEKFALSVVMNYGHDSNKLPSNPDMVIRSLQLPAIAPKLYDDNGNLNYELGPNGLSTWENPIGTLKNVSKSAISNLIVNALLSYELIPYLTIKTNLGFTEVNQNEISTAPIAAKSPESRPTSFGSSQFAFSKRNSWIVEPQLHFSRKLKDHQLDALLGITFQEADMERLTISAGGYTSDASIENLGSATSYVATNSNSQYKYNALFLRGAYNYKSKYLLNLTGRRDGSSRFGPGNRFGNFGSIGSAWVFSKENFLSNKLQFLSLGKLRTSIARTGNDQIGDYKYYNVYQASASNYQSGSSLSPRSLYNPDYAWEVTQKVEAAVELGFWDNRLLLEINYYNNRSSNQLIDYALPSTTGFSSVTTNFGATIENAGWELMVNSTNISRGRFRWTSAMNVSMPTNVLLRYDGIENSPYATIYAVGQPLSVRNLYTYIGVSPETGRPIFLDLNRDGIINYQDQRVMQPLIKNYYGGITNSFQYKGFELVLLVQFASQHATKYLRDMPGRYGNQPVQVLDRWQNIGDEGKGVKFSQDLTTSLPEFQKLINSDYNYEDSSYARLKTATLSYAFPSGVVRKAKINTMRLFIQGQNLYTVTSYNNLDPETGSGIPPLRIVTMGVQITL